MEVGRKSATIDEYDDNIWQGKMATCFVHSRSEDEDVLPRRV